MLSDIFHNIIILMSVTYRTSKGTNAIRGEGRACSVPGSSLTALCLLITYCFYQILEVGTMFMFLLWNQRDIDLLVLDACVQGSANIFCTRPFSNISGFVAHTVSVAMT